jgi:hypothetical protein
MKSLTSPFLKIFSLVIVLATASTGCQKNADLSSGSNGISVFLTDDPSMIFDNIFIDIQKVEIKAEDNSEAEHHGGKGSDDGAGDGHGGTSGGWITLNSTPGIQDILKFRNGLDTLFSTGSFAPGRSLTKIRLTLGNNNKAVLNGVTSALTLKNNIIVINLEEALVQLNTSANINVWLDFDGGLSVRRHGNEFELEPHIKAFSKEKAGSIEGRVSPAEAKAVVMAINGSDTATAKPEREGEFKITGLKAGSYKLLVHPTVNNYVDATINNINVSGKEDTHVGNITLHK